MILFFKLEPVHAGMDKSERLWNLSLVKISLLGWLTLVEFRVMVRPGIVTLDSLLQLHLLSQTVRPLQPQP